MSTVNWKMLLMTVKIAAPLNHAMMTLSLVWKKPVSINHRGKKCYVPIFGNAESSTGIVPVKLFDMRVKVTVGARRVSVGC